MKKSESSSSLKKGDKKGDAEPAKDDLLDDLAGAMGDDFGFGFGFGDEEGDPNVPPKDLPAPVEKSLASRTSESITLKWKPIGQALTKLVLQGMPYLEGKKPFAEGFDLIKGGMQTQVADPETASEATLSGLLRNNAYAFRLVATNPAATTEGPVSDPIKTIGQHDTPLCNHLMPF